MEKTVYSSQAEEAVDKLVEILCGNGSPEIKTLVGHRFPDDDAWLCFWIAKRFIPRAAKAIVTFVSAGGILPGTENDPSVLHFDTGGGEYDQHKTKSWRQSSANILARKLGEKINLKEPALIPLIDLATAVDNVKPLPPTSIHFIIEGYPRLLKKNGSGAINWEEVQRKVFELFDIVYNQEKQRIESREKLKEFARWINLPNGIRIASILEHPEIREAAFEAGATVVIWTQSRGNGRFYTGIQRHRDSEVRLNEIAANLRWAETKERGIDARGKNLQFIGQSEDMPWWYLHDSLALILNGSRSHPLKGNEYTELQAQQIVAITRNALSKLPPITVKE